MESWLEEIAQGLIVFGDDPLNICLFKCCWTLQSSTTLLILIFINQHVYRPESGGLSYTPYPQLLTIQKHGTFIFLLGLDFQCSLGKTLTSPLVFLSSSAQLLWFVSLFLFYGFCTNKLTITCIYSPKVILSWCCPPTGSLEFMYYHAR